ncbi:GUN4 domain-containing protein [Nostoc sp. FACHB-145]|uniref:nSTAND1 domain-containing NTPase n=1 Tax=Nostoc sp. FACHB-145 TaxID=2692836 RepID=UPI00168A0375|nr:GUN4 domain-containing protein [Nostoc sp. FACHB-145]MBD2472416.1 GUN4 domain-containing protein [Nostoc sp. FACHB-145]
MSEFINYTITVRNKGEIVPQIGDSESQHGQFKEEFLEDIEQSLSLLEKYTKREQFTYLGKKLFKALLEPVAVSFAGQVWTRYIIESELTNLRIRIVFEEVNEPTKLASQIINLPWEFLCYPDDNDTFLGTHSRVALSYSYQNWLNNPLDGYAVRESPLRVLFVHGHPKKLPVGFADRVPKILTELAETVKVKELKNPTPDELSEALKEKPHVLHFLGHGKPGALALGDQPDEEPSWLEDRSLSDFLRAGGVKLVVLQACEGASPSEELAFTGTAAHLVKTHIPAVIAFRYPISQSLAWNFVKTLYAKLADGEPVDVAVQAGREKLSIGNQSYTSRDFGAPVLWMRLRDGLLFAAGDKTPERREEKKEDKPLTDKMGEVICPYQGLNAFTEETKQFFFGRVRKVEEIEQMLNQQSFVPVIGASGSGKSSVVLAGLIPRLKELGGWEILPPIQPGDDPIAKLKNLFEPYFPKSKKELQQLNDFLNKEPPNLQGLIERLSDSERFLLVVDQFEELFTLCVDGDKQKQFINLLSQVSIQSRLSVVITLRADFVVDCLNYSDLAQLLGNSVLMPPLEGANLEAAIVKPAKCQGYGFEEGLLGEILKDVANEKGILPLLEFALTQLWKKGDGERHLLTLDGYKVIDGVIGALNRYADELYGQFKEQQRQEWVKRIFLQLLQTGEGTKDTRKWQRKQNLLSVVGDNEEEREAFSEVLEQLICGRLLVTKQEREDGHLVDVVDLAHEALIEGWKQLNQWRQENREIRELAERIEKAKRAWNSHQKDSKYLLDGNLREECHSRLASLTNHLGLSNPALDFVKQSLAVFSFESLIDYRQLDRLLKEEEWKKADEETLRVMLAAKSEEKRYFLDKDDFDRFPCEDLQKINELWLKYSNGKFGFSVQKEIYESLGGTRKYIVGVWEKFGYSVGWRNGESDTRGEKAKWLSYSQLTFNLDAPRGHLPCVLRVDEMIEVGDLVCVWPQGDREWTSPVSEYRESSLLTHKDL